MMTAYSIPLSWIFLHSRGSVLIATLFDGAINVTQGLFLAGSEPGSSIGKVRPGGTSWSDRVGQPRRRGVPYADRSLRLLGLLQVGEVGAHVGDHGDRAEPKM